MGGEITNYTSVENIAYDNTNKKLMLKVEGADTPIPFSSGAKYLGQFSSNTTINVSAYGATSVNQFLIVPASSKSASTSATGVNGSGRIDITNLSIAFTPPSLSLSGSTLTVRVGSISGSADAQAYDNWQYYYKCGASTSGVIPVKVYYVGDIY